MQHLWPPLLLSLKVALVATALVALVGVPLAYAMARRRSRARACSKRCCIVPLVLPPTVVGYFILVAVGARSADRAGAATDAFDYSLLFNWHGAVLAAAVVALPLLYLPAKAAFASVERELEDIARLMGASRLQVFWHVSLPLARRGIASGLLLASPGRWGSSARRSWCWATCPDGRRCRSRSTTTTSPATSRARAPARAWR